MNRYLKGIVCANITPFDKYGNVDFDSLKRLTKYLVDVGISAIYPSGTNGEGLALTVDERNLITKTIVDSTNGKIPVAIQCGSQTLDDTIKLIKFAKESGANAAGVVTPFFFHQHQNAILEYYTSIFDTIRDFPIYIYNIPSHTNNDILPTSIKFLADKYENLAGIKYSHPDLIRLSEYIDARSEGLDTLIGCDKLIYPAAKVGAVGTVSGPAAVFPELFTSLWKAIEKNDEEKALNIQHTISCNDKLLSQYQSIPLLKIYLKQQGIIEDSYCRIPFGKVSAKEEEAILNDIKNLKNI